MRAIHYLYIILVLMIGFRMAGLITGGSPLFDVIFNISNLETLPLGILIFGLFSGLGVIVLGLSGVLKIDQLIIVPLVVVMLNYVLEARGIYLAILGTSSYPSLHYWLATLLCVPMIILGVFLMVEWWRGKDW